MLEGGAERWKRDKLNVTISRSCSSTHGQVLFVFRYQHASFHSSSQMAMYVCYIQEGDSV